MSYWSIPQAKYMIQLPGTGKHTRAEPKLPGTNNFLGKKKHKHLFIPLLANHDLYFGLKNGFSRAERRVKRVGVGWSPALILLHRASTAAVPSLGITCG